MFRAPAPTSRVAARPVRWVEQSFIPCRPVGNDLRRTSLEREHGVRPQQNGDSLLANETRAVARSRSCRRIRMSGATGSAVGHAVCYGSAIIAIIAIIEP